MINIKELLKKFRTIQDRVNFCRENGLYLPTDSGFDAKFFVQVLQGTKTLLPLGGMTGYDFKYFTKEKKFTKKHLWSFFEKYPELKKYIPDDLSYIRLKREFLLAIIAHAKKDLYISLYNSYKEILANSVNSKWQDYGVELKEDFKRSIDNFIPSNTNPKERPFRLFKNGERIKEIKNLKREDEDMEDGE